MVKRVRRWDLRNGFGGEAITRFNLEQGGLGLVGAGEFNNAFSSRRDQLEQTSASSSRGLK